jgi:hypothetical protein
MKWVRLVLCAVLFTPMCAVLGGIGSIDGRGEAWSGLVIGGLVGLFFGLYFGGARGGLLGIVFPPGDKRTMAERNS